MSKTPPFYQQFRADHAAVAAAYQQLADACRADGPLDERTAELVKLGMSIALGAEGGTHSHTRRALAAGVSRGELEQVAMLAITTLGFPQAMRGLAWMRDVMDVPAKG